MGIEQSKSTESSIAKVQSPDFEIINPEATVNSKDATSKEIPFPKSVESSFTDSEVSKDSHNDHSSSNLSIPKENPPKILVVHSLMKSKAEVDPDIEKLLDLTSFYPLIPSSSDPKWNYYKKKSSLNAMDNKAILTICCDYQEYFRSCHKQMIENQKVLCTSVKNIQLLTSKALSSLMIHSNEIRTVTSQMKQINHVNQITLEIRESIEELLKLTENLNNLLPEEISLENIFDSLNMRFEKERERRLKSAMMS